MGGPLDSNVDIRIRAHDQASPVIKKLKANVTSLGTRNTGPLSGLMSGMAGLSPAFIGGAMAVGALTAALADGVAGALAEEKQLARLDTALQANVAGWDGNREAVDRAVDSMMELAFADDEARESMIKLVTGTGDVALSTRQMGLAANIARGRNIDLAAATDIVIKANMGNVGALRRAGIEIDKNATSTEILTTLSGRYFGQAEAYANTTAGKFEKAQIKVNEAMEDFGANLVSVASGFMALQEARQGDTEAISDLTRAAAVFLPILTPLVDKLDEMRETTFTSGELDAFQRGLLAMPTVAKSATEAADSVLEAIKAKGPAYIDAAKKIGEDTGNALASKLSGNLVDSLKGNKGFVKGAMKDMMWALNHPQAMERQLARIQTALDSPQLAALLSGNPMQRLIGGQIRDRLTGQVEALTDKTYNDGVNRIVGAINGLKGAGYKPAFGSDFGYPGYAAGGDAKGSFVVGERGPEVIHLGNRGGHVTPNHQMGGHGHPIILNGRILGQAVDEYLGNQLSRMPTAPIHRG